MKDQIRRAAVSISANIAEGFARCSDRQFAQFLYNARGSAGEVGSLLYIARDQDCIAADEFGRVSALAEDVAKALFGYIRYLQPPPQNWHVDFQTCDLRLSFRPVQVGG